MLGSGVVNGTGGGVDGTTLMGATCLKDGWICVGSGSETCILVLGAGGWVLENGAGVRVLVFGTGGQVLVLGTGGRVPGTMG